jgi:L-asparaginase / beta-aspartyl-peptidase
MATNSTPRILIHGGAGAWTNREPEAVIAGVRAGALRGWEVLRNGGSALDAAEAAVILLEDDPLFDAGVGSFVNDQGEVEMDALFADGRAIQFGAVAGVRRIKHPISLARLVMEKTPHCFFVSDGAEELAVSLGMALVPNIEFITEAEFALFRARRGSGQPREGLGTGTVGAVAIDAQGHLASATSTGGVPDKKKGRVGDTPIFGAGGYADDRYGAASATGKGENIMRFLVCKDVADRIASGLDAQTAADAALKRMLEHLPEPDAGVIVVDARGNLGAAHTTRAMPVAWVDAEGNIHARMKVEGNMFG